MNDGGSIRIDGGNTVFTAAGNKILNNKIHDVTDASDHGFQRLRRPRNLYGRPYRPGGRGEQSGVSRLRRSRCTLRTARPRPTSPIPSGTTFWRLRGWLWSATPGPTADGVPASVDQAFVVNNNLFLLRPRERFRSAIPGAGRMRVQRRLPVYAFQLFSSNLYWRTDGGFCRPTPKRSTCNPKPGTGPNAPCSDDTDYLDVLYLRAVAAAVGEDPQSVVQNPGFANPVLSRGRLLAAQGIAGRRVCSFDPNQAGRTNPVIKPPAVPATFPTKTFNPATDY